VSKSAGARSVSAERDPRLTGLILPVIFGEEGVIGLKCEVPFSLSSFVGLILSKPLYLGVGNFLQHAGDQITATRVGGLIRFRQVMAERWLAPGSATMLSRPQAGELRNDKLRRRGCLCGMQSESQGAESCDRRAGIDLPFFGR